MHALLPLLLACTAQPLGAQPAHPIAPRFAPLPQETLDLKGDLDRSVRWLRSKQDPKTGAYGGAFEPTAWTLLAFARCPRHYRPVDGPFVQDALDHLLGHAQEDGSIHAPGASPEDRLYQTGLAAEVLGHHVTPESARALASALKWMEATRPGSTDEGPSAEVGFGPSKIVEEFAHGEAVKLLSGRGRDGSWPGTDTNGGAVQATAQAVLQLSDCYTVLKPKSERRGVTALPEAATVDREAVDRSILSGARFLIGAAEDGLWGAPGHPDAGITAMVLAALHAVAEPRPEDVQSALDRGLEWLAARQHEDGSIHDGRLHNYVTSASILALARAGDRYRAQVVRARDYLVNLQSDEGEGYSPEHHYYGGMGYGGDERPDLSNLQMALEALSVSGLESDHAAYGRALTFLERCQNRSESNDLELASDGSVLVSGDDGGSAYAPGNSPAGYIELEGGKKVPRSYGSMSYALLKGYIFAGLERDDPRVEALWTWLQANYTLDVNPGFEYAEDPAAAYQGLFYYFNTMARALDLYGAEELVDAEGRRHPWRAELAARLVAMQSRADGSWVNGNAPRWWEGNPVLATAYALATLELTR